MSELSDAVRERLAFDDSLVYKNSFESTPRREGFNNFQCGAKFERARTTALDAILVECVEALEEISGKSDDCAVRVTIEIANDQLTRLRELIEGGS